MELIILGSGTSIPLIDRGSPALAVMIDNTPVLLDMGPGTLHQINRAGLDFRQIRQIFITHLHPDHTADLIHFLFACRNPGIIDQRSPFTLFGPTGLRDLIRDLQHAYPDWLTLPSELMTVYEIATGRNTQMDFPGFKLISGPAEHTRYSLAYGIEDSETGKRIVCSGDTGFSEDIISLAKGADLLVLECSFPDDNPIAGHLTPSQAGQMAAVAHVKHLVLTHFYPEVLETDIEGQCRRTYEGKLTLAEDFMRIPI